MTYIIPYYILTIFGVDGTNVSICFQVSCVEIKQVSMLTGMTEGNIIWLRRSTDPLNPGWF